MTLDTITTKIKAIFTHRIARWIYFIYAFSFALAIIILSFIGSWVLGILALLGIIDLSIWIWVLALDYHKEFDHAS